MSATAMTGRETSGIYAYAGNDLTWLDANKPGIRMASVRSDRAAGLYFGYISFERFATTGLHQHLGPATSYFLQGQLTDYPGTAYAGEMGINFKGSTHDAIAYEPTLLAGRLDAAVIYPEAASAEGTAIHTGGVSGTIENKAPEVMPDINITVAGLPWLATATAGVVRREVWDYSGTDMDRRLIQIQVLPGTSLPALAVSALTDISVLAGDLNLSGRVIGSGCFAVIEAGAEVQLASRYGANIFVWAEGPADWLDGQTRPDPWGFRLAL